MKDSRARILIVDDESSNIAILSDILSSEFEMFAAKSGEEALRRASSESPPDIILLDVRMPGMDGYEACARLRETPGTRVIPIIFVTAVNDAENEAMGLELGAVDYITRPFSPAIVRARVKNHLELSRARRESEARYKILFANATDGILIQDLSGCALEVNEAFCMNTGYSREEILGMTTLDLVLESDAGLHAERFARVKLEGYGLFEVCHVRKDGTAFPVEVNMRLMELDGWPATLAVCRDITERRKAEEELKRYRERLEELVARRTAELREKEETVARLERSLTKRRGFHGLVGRSEAMQAVYSRIEDLADVPSTVLITGESGTGKDLAAEALHYGGAYRAKPLVKVVCSALPENLIESELFGHVSGAFTGAVRNRVGRLEKVGGGTLFLDEIGDIPPLFQLRLLGVLQEKKFERMGDSTPIRMEARIVAATHRNLLEMVQRGEFREDLYYRLKVVELHLPPLREHKEDIPVLVSHFLALLREELKKNVTDVSSDVLGTFMAHSWPGNVRELGHVLEHACVVCKGSVIGVSDLPRDLSTSAERPISEETGNSGEVRTILEALHRAKWNKTLAAGLMGVSRRTFYRKLAQIPPEDLA